MVRSQSGEPIVRPDMGLGDVAHLAELSAASTPLERLKAIARVESALAELRQVVAVEVILGGGSYADVGRAVGTTRQAAYKVYRPAVAAAERDHWPT